MFAWLFTCSNNLMLLLRPVGVHELNVLLSIFFYILLNYNTRLTSYPAIQEQAFFISIFYMTQLMTTMTCVHHYMVLSHQIHI